MAEIFLGSLIGSTSIPNTSIPRREGGNVMFGWYQIPAGLSARPRAARKIMVARLSAEIYNILKGGAAMPADTSMLHVRIDNRVKDAAALALANIGITLSEAVRIFLTRVVEDGGLPAGLTATQGQYDAWFSAKVRESLDDPSPGVPFEEAMKKLWSLVNGE
jgi:DNA-damage-inducible protein J